MSEKTPKTPTAPARPPNGFPIGHYRYRNYFLFAWTSVFMFVGGVVLLLGVQALGAGEEAWSDYLAFLGQPGMLLLNVVVLVFSLYFVLRWSWIGRKIAKGRVGPIPRNPLPMPVLGVAPIFVFALAWVFILIILGGTLA